MAEDWPGRDLVGGVPTTEPVEDFLRREMLRMRDAALVGYGALLALNGDGRAMGALGTMATMLFGADHQVPPPRDSSADAGDASAPDARKSVPPE